MLAALLIVLLLAAAPAQVCAQPAAGDAGLPVEDILRTVSSYWPRMEGSRAEEELLAWIEGRLASMEIPSASFDFARSDFEHSFSRCLRVDIPGKSRDTLILAVPIDGPTDAAPGADGSINVALAVDLLQRLKGTVPPLSLTVLFLGAEYGDTDAYPMGSTLFLSEYQPDFKVAVLYLNLRAAPSRILIRGGGRGIVSPYWLITRSVTALRAAQVPVRLQGDELQVFRLGATDERTMIEPWLRAGYPAVGLEGIDAGGGGSGEPAAGLASLSEFLRGFVGAGGAGIPEEWDRHYLLFQAGDASLIVSEKAYVGILAGTLAAGLLLFLALLRRQEKNLRILFRNLPGIIPLTALTLLFLLAGTYALRGILALRGFPGLWKYAPLQFLALKVCIAMFLYSLLYNPLRRLPFPRGGSFYSAAALFLLVVEIAVIAVFDVSFTYYFLWAFLFVCLSSLARNRWLKAILALPAPLWGIQGIVTVFLAPALPFCHFLTLSPLQGNLLVASACLPFILVLLRLGLLFPGRGPLRRGVREIVFAGLFLAVGVALGLRLLLFSPFSPANPQPLEVTQIVVVDASDRTTSTTLAFDSPAPFGAVSVTDATGRRHISPSATDARLTLPLVEPPVRIDVDTRQFLEQRTVALRVDMPARPRLFALTVTSAQDFILYDSSFPAVRVGPREYRLLVGAFPPNPLGLQVTLPTGQAFTFTLSADFDSPLMGVEVSTRPNLRVATRVRVVRSLEVKT